MLSLDADLAVIRVVVSSHAHSFVYSVCVCVCLCDSTLSTSAVGCVWCCLCWDALCVPQAVRVTKPKIPESIRRNYELMWVLPATTQHSSTQCNPAQLHTHTNPHTKSPTHLLSDSQIGLECIRCRRHFSKGAVNNKDTAWRLKQFLREMEEEGYICKGNTHHAMGIDGLSHHPLSILDSSSAQLALTSLRELKMMQCCS